MDELDDLLRATFRTRERDMAFDVSGLAPAAAAGHLRRKAKQRRGLVVGAVGVLAVGASSTVALWPHDSQPAATTVTAGTPPIPGALPLAGAGGVPGISGATGLPRALTSAHPLPVGESRAWSSHGLQVRVPAAWDANHQQCGTPTADTVLIGGGATTACMLVPEPVVDVVAFGRPFSARSPGKGTSSSATVNGHAARIGYQRLQDGRTDVVVEIPDLDASVEIKGKSPELVGSILASAQVVDVDGHGCASRVGSVLPSGPPSRSGAQQTMVPGDPVQAIVCHYESPGKPGQPASDGLTLLAAGSEVPTGQLRGLTELFNDLKPGQATWQGLAESCYPAAREGYVFRFIYASGPPVDVYLHSYNCDHMGLDNGTVTGLIPEKFVVDSMKYMPEMGFRASGEAVSK